MLTGFRKPHRQGHKLLQILSCIGPSAVAGSNRIGQFIQIDPKHEMHAVDVEEMLDHFENRQGIVRTATVKFVDGDHKAALLAVGVLRQVAQGLPEGFHL